MGKATFKVFHTGDHVVITSDHLIIKGQYGTIKRWVHGDWYVATLVSGKDAVVRAAEMEAEATQ